MFFLHKIFSIFSSNLIYLCYINLFELKSFHQNFCSLNYLLLNIVYFKSSCNIFFNHISLSFFEFTRTVLNLSASKSFTFIFELFKQLGTLTNLLISTFSTSAFKVIKSLLTAKLDLSILEASSNSFL